MTAVPRKKASVPQGLEKRGTPKAESSQGLTGRVPNVPAVPSWEESSIYASIPHVDLELFGGGESLVCEFIKREQREQREQVYIKPRNHEVFSVPNPVPGSQDPGERSESPEKVPQIDAKSLPHPEVIRGEKAPESGAEADPWRFEVMTLPVRDLLPERGLASTTIYVMHPDFGAMLWTSGRIRYREAVKAGELVWTPVELVAMAAALEDGGFSRPRWGLWAEQKQKHPGWRMSPSEGFGARIGQQRWDALQAAPAWSSSATVEDVFWEGDDRCPGHWMTRGVTVGRLLGAIGAELVGVEVEGVPLGGDVE